MADTYQLERELGRGGMATVYLARDLKHPRRVAVKVLRPELAGVMTRGRFLREIRISSELTHPNILPLLDSGTAPPTDQSPALPYFTMPYVEGETLADRLRREKQLPLEDALRIAREIGTALGYAHGRGVIHRDIKPGNILLMDGHAVVSDFGIARAVKESVDPDAVTSAGLVIGTPSYMSPEQAAGDEELDGRSDIYALGCVLYEMLAGEPPFTGTTPQAILARHRLDPTPSLRTLRASVPGAVEQTIRRALEKSPADRFATAEQFVEALQPRASGDWDPAETRAVPRPTSVRRVVAALLAIVGVAGVWYLAGGGAAGRRATAAAASLDTTRYAIVSFSQGSSVPELLRPALLLQDALARWEGIQVVDLFQVREAVARHDTTGYARKDWDRLAGQLGAGRYIRADAARVGDSIRVHAVLYAVVPGADDPVIREQTVQLPIDLTGRSERFAELGERLLVGAPAAGGYQPISRTTSLPARQAFEAGTSALKDWDLAAADSSFAAAVRFDPGYAQAHLWLALVRIWADAGRATWESSAERAVAGRADLAMRDRQMADAVLAQGRGDMLTSCRQWGTLTDENPYDFVVWYGLASCLRQDRTVVRDARSPTGWRFQSSYHAALEAYTHAYRLFPSILSGFRTESFAGIVELLYAGSNMARLGRGIPPDPPSFYAFPAWAGDSLVFFPAVYGPNGFTYGPATATTAEAIRHQRRRLYDIARGWVTAYPASADALQALGVSLQLLGDRSALDTLEKARRLAKTPDETIRVATAEIWMRVLFAAPSGFWELRVARRLADSLLANAPTDGSVEPMLLASLAALTGKAHLAARLGRAIDPGERPDTPPPLVGLGVTFLTYAAMGGPVDSLGPLARRVREALGPSMDEETRFRAREMWLQLPVLVGFPVYQFPDVTSFATGNGWLLAADAAFLRGDTAAAWQALAPARRTRPAGQPNQTTVDMGYGTAWMMAALGRPEAAAAYLDKILTALPTTQPQFFLQVYQAGPLVRAMALRAELANRLGDRESAGRWATAVTTLWSGADDFLQPLVKRMEVLAR